MGKKKNKKKNKEMENDYYSDVKYLLTRATIDFDLDKSRKAYANDFRDVLTEIECYRIQLAEADKKADRKSRRKINKKSEEFYTGMESIKARSKMAKTWEKTGFLDRVIMILEQTAPIIKCIAKLVMGLIITFLSVDAIKSRIQPSTVEKLSKVFHIAMSV